MDYAMRLTQCLLEREMLKISSPRIEWISIVVYCYDAPFTKALMPTFFGLYKFHTHCFMLYLYTTQFSRDIHSLCVHIRVGQY